MAYPLFFLSGLAIASASSFLPSVAPPRLTSPRPSYRFKHCLPPRFLPYTTYLPTSLRLAFHLPSPQTSSRSFRPRAPFALVLLTLVLFQLFRRAPNNAPPPSAF
ncbi:hypothetical protein GGF50DRAFT_121899 [Schizophyllum commune]